MTTHAPAPSTVLPEPYIPGPNDTEHTAYGLHISSLSEDGDMIAIGPDAGDPRRALAAFHAYHRHVIGWEWDGPQRLREDLADGHLVLAICPTRFRPPTEEERDDYAWIAEPHALGALPAAWLVDPTHPAAGRGAARS